MNQSSKPSLTEIDQLIEFLPILYAEGYKPIKEWHGGVKNKDGVKQLPYPDYDEAVIKFYRAASQDCWVDHRYKPNEAKRILENKKAVALASLDEIRTVLTFCVRGERFCDGHWGAMIIEGYVRQILERLIALRQQMGEDPKA